MNIAILGYGKMGKTIETIARERKHSLIYKTSEKIDSQQLRKADVAIDFSIPEAAFENVTTCFKNQVPVICGTTGWLDRYEDAIKICNEHNGSFLYTSNFSIGVNIFFELNKTLAKMMASLDDYAVNLEEIHHLQKLDKPSGTAITLAQQIIAEKKKKTWQLVEKDEQTDTNILPVKAIREKNVHGTHRITYVSAIDEIEIKHTAHSREGFAKGAVIAAEWIQHKKGVFGMKDVLKNLF